MKKYKLCLLTMIFSIALSGQNGGLSPLVVNEVGVMPSDYTRFIELVVVGGGNNQQTSVNLQGWILDNNSDGFTNDNAFIVLGSEFSNISPGTVILLYDAVNPHPKINIQEDGLPNAMGVYQLSFSSNAIDICSKESNYDCAGPVFSTSTWNYILPLTYASDAVQLRDPNQNLRQAVSWSSSFAGNTDVNTTSIQLSDPIIALDTKCNTSEFQYDGSTEATPGKPNSERNGYFLQSLQPGGNALPNPLQISANGTSANSEIEINITGGSSPYTISWNGPSNNNITLPDTDPYTINNLSPGTYEVNVEDGYGCKSTTTVALGTPNGPPLSAFSIDCSSQPSTGSDGSITVDISGGNPFYHIQWSGPSSGWVDLQDEGAFTIPNLPIGFYTITVFDSNENRLECTSFVGEDVPPVNTCIGGCVTIGVPDVSCFTWEPKIGLSNPESSQTEVCSVIDRTYKLIILNEAGDILEVKHYTIEINNPKINVSPSPGIICGTGNVLLEGDNGYNTYEWTDASGTVVSTASTYDTSIPGAYHLIVTDENGCSAETDVSVIDVSDPENVKTYLEAQGFIYIPINVLDDYPTVAPPSNNNKKKSALTVVDDCVQKIIQYDSNEELVGLRDVIEFDLLRAEEVGLNGVGKIIGYDDFCNNNNTCSANSFFDVQGFDCSIQGYIYDEPNSMDDYLMVKVNTVSVEKISDLISPVPTVELIAKKGSCGFGTLDAEPCSSWGPELDYSVAKDGDNYYGYNCVDGDWVKGDIVEIKRKDQLLDFKDNCWGNEPFNLVYSSPVVLPGGLQVTVAHYPSSIAYWFVMTPTPTQTIEDKFIDGFDFYFGLDIDYQVQKDIITDHFIKGFPVPGPTPGPDPNCNNESSNTPLIWECNSALSNGLIYTTPVRNWANKIRNVYVNWFTDTNNETLDGLFLPENNTTQGNLNFGGIDPVKIENPFWTYQVFGGTQEFTVETTDFYGYHTVNGIAFTCNVHLTITDTFGADAKDAERWYLPGLPAFWVLQHFRNADSALSSRCDEAPCYVPYKHSVIIPYEFAN
ncbi:MAG: SprB repeat-containing protein [Saprospiraceae bacterium]